MPAIHQITAGFRRGDAITNMSQELQRVFRSWGYASDIFVEPSRTAPECRSAVIPLDRVASVNDDDILILHLSIGSHANARFPSLPGRKVICYHNVTPAHYFEGLNPAISAALDEGRRQSAELRNVPELTFADSAYNAAELETIGYRDVHVLPFMMSIGQLTEERSKSIELRLSDGFKNILFVGRCVPNKRIDRLIETFFWFQKNVEPRSRLIHVGSYDGLEAYHALLLSQVSDLGLKEHVWLTGSVSQAELNSFYRKADLFLCLSEHEGFCVPLLEAMLHNVPVIAAAKAAVPETLDGSGILLTTEETPVIAEIMGRIVRDNTLRQAVTDGQSQRINCYRNRDLASELHQLMGKMLSGEAK